MADNPWTAVELDFPGFDPEEMVERARRFAEHMVRRRTVRDFDSRPVPEGVIEAALRTAASAPSGANLQPWRFVVVRDAAIRARLREAAEAEEREFYGGKAPPEWLAALAPLGTDTNKPFLVEAPVLIAIFMQRYIVGDDGKRVRNYYHSESVGIAAGFLIAALHHAGLATLTHTPSPMGFLSEILERPRNEKPYILFPVGFPAPDCEVPDLRRKSLAEVTQWFSGRTGRPAADAD